jgi:ABC-type branched-subunit amino acid transport system substrate-binding protein
MAVAMKDPLPPLQLNPDLPPALCDLIVRLLAKKPQDRPASAHEVVASLQSVADGLGISGPTPTSGIRRGVSTMGVRPVVPPSRRKMMIGLAILTGLLALGLLSWLCYALLVPPRNDEIVLGMSGPLQGPSKELGLEMEIGIKTYIEHVNEHGGVHGRRLRLDPHDDGYEPDKALQNMQRFHEQNVFAVIGNIGTPTALETVPYAVNNKMLFFGAFTGANILRRVPPDRYVFNYRASYEEETAKIVEYLVEIRRIAPDQIAVFDQNDGYGDAGFNGVVKVMRDKFKRDKKDIVRVRYKRNTQEGIPEAVQTIVDHKELRAIVMVGTYGPVTEFIRRVKDVNPNLIFTNVSFVGSEALAGRLKELGDRYSAGVIVTQVVPPIESGASIVLKYKEDLKKYYPNALPTFTSLEGYISTSLFVEGLKRAGRNATPEDVINALETIDNLDLGTGAPLTFSRSRHQASHTVWATVLDKQGKFQVLDMTE